MLTAGAAWALWSLTLAERADALGAVLFLLFVGFVYNCVFDAAALLLWHGVAAQPRHIGQKRNTLAENA